MVPNLRYAYGRFLLGAEDLDGAVAQFLAEIENQPGHVRARMLIASARYRIDSAAGIPFAREVVKLQPRYPFGHYLLGLLYFDVGDIARAMPALEEAARLVPQEPQFQFALGNAYARAGRKEDAARARAAFVRLRNGDASAVTSEYAKQPHFGLDDAARAEPSEPTPKRRPKN
jgi:predicted Zn-dependent protease